MENDIFRGGTRPGSPTSEMEIKMLLCYILSNQPESMSFSQLYEAVTEDGLINYFELIRLLEELVRLEHLSIHREEGLPDRYTATQLGQQASREFERNLPFSVRERALGASQRVMERHRRLTEVQMTETEEGDGIRLELSIPDGEGELLSLKVYAPTREECDEMKRQFLNAPLTIYKGVMALLTGDEKVLGEIFTQEEHLF